MPETHMIDRVQLANGEWVMLDELPCANCDMPGCTHIAMWNDGAMPFCSWEHLTDSMRIDGEPLTEETMKAAGMVVMGPRSQA